MPTKIEWCDETLNPLGWGCYGPGGIPENPNICVNCYAKAFADRKLSKCDLCNKFIPHWHTKALEKPLQWKKTRVIFWQDMGDLWHPFTPYSDISATLETAIAADHHTHLFLTKNPKRYLEFEGHLKYIKKGFYGATVRTQTEANDLVSEILKLAVLGFKVFLSVEPMLGKTILPKECFVTKELKSWPACNSQQINIKNQIHGVICGGETGLEARPMHPDWVRNLKNQCQAAGVPFFFKSWGEWKAADDQYQGIEYAKLAKNKKTPCCQAKGSPLVLWNIGRKNAGRILDGQEWNELPWKNHEK